MTEVQESDLDGDQHNIAFIFHKTEPKNVV